MKRIIAILILAALPAFTAGAQWYLFGLQDEKASGDSTVRLNLVLPLTGEENRVDHNFYDFYSGALLAAEELGEEGIKLELNVINTGERMITAGEINEAHATLGPVKPDEILKTLNFVDSTRYLVSILDPKADTLTDSLNVIQVPAPSSCQVDEIVDWLAEEYREGDIAVVVMNDRIEDEANTRAINLLTEKGIRFSIVQDLLNIQTSPEANVRILRVAEHNDQINGIARNAGILARNRSNVYFYTTTKSRALDGTSVANQYICNTRLAGSYYVDYRNGEVKSFILDYRRHFSAEPTQFSFSGYDTVKYFGKLCSEYGKEWKTMIDTYRHEGLQTDFHFSSENMRGSRNKAVRRVRFDSVTSNCLQ